MTDSDEDLSQEQLYSLRRAAVEAQEMSRSALIEALCASLEARFRERAYFEGVFRSHGMSVRVKETYPWQPPETEEEFKCEMGYVPTAAEARRFVEDRYRDARMELDIDDIVATPDPESGI